MQTVPIRRLVASRLQRHGVLGWVNPVDDEVSQGLGDQSSCPKPILSLVCALEPVDHAFQSIYPIG